MPVQSRRWPSSPGAALEHKSKCSYDPLSCRSCPGKCSAAPLERERETACVAGYSSGLERMCEGL